MESVWIALAGIGVALADFVEQDPDVAKLAALEPGPDVDGLITWQPGFTQLAAITPPGSTGQRLAGLSLMVLPSEDQPLFRSVEDGFALFLLPAQRAELIAALRGGRDYALPVCTLRWIDATS